MSYPYPDTPKRTEYLNNDVSYITNSSRSVSSNSGITCDLTNASAVFTADYLLGDGQKKLVSGIIMGLTTASSTTYYPVKTLTAGTTISDYKILFHEATTNLPNQITWATGYFNEAAVMRINGYTAGATWDAVKLALATAPKSFANFYWN